MQTFLCFQMGRKMSVSHVNETEFYSGNASLLLDLEPCALSICQCGRKKNRTKFDNIFFKSLAFTSKTSLPKSSWNTASYWNIYWYMFQGYNDYKTCFLRRKLGWPMNIAISDQFVNLQYKLMLDSLIQHVDEKNSKP